MRESLQDKIDYSIDLLRKAEKMALRFDHENGFWLAFSGGKDSQALYHVAQMAGVRFKAHMNLTSVDPPEVIRFVKLQYPDVELIKPRMSIFEMAKRKHILPTMRFRWCCAEFKETSGVGKVTLIGIRKQESARRSKRNEVELGNHKFSGNFDQWSEHEEKMESISYTQFMGGEMNDTMYEIPINGNLLDSAYEMLCWCIKEGYVKTKN